MHGDLKHKDILQVSLEIQNLKYPAYFLPPQLYQPIEPSLPVKLQVVTPNLWDIQPHPLQVWHCDEILFDPNGNWNKMVRTYKFFTDDRIWSTHTGERAPFCCTALIFKCTGGKCFIFPVVVHHITHYAQDLHYNVPSDWVIHNSPSVYMYHYVWHKSMYHF